MTPYDDRDLGQQVMAIYHQVITWTYIDFSVVKFYGIPWDQFTTYPSLSKYKMFVPVP